MKLKKVSNFKMQVHADSRKARGKNLQVFTLRYSKGHHQTRLSTVQVVYVPMKAFKLPSGLLDWAEMPKIAVYKDWKYWYAADFQTGLTFPGCHGETVEEAVHATLKKLSEVGEKLYWKMQRDNVRIAHAAGVVLNGEFVKPTAKQVSVEAFTGTQLSLL